MYNRHIIFEMTGDIIEVPAADAPLMLIQSIFGPEKAICLWFSGDDFADLRENGVGIS